MMNFAKLEVRIDSVEVVNDITNNKASKLCGKALIERICVMLKYDWEVVIKHTYREANQLADGLANRSYSLEDKLCLFPDCPAYCKHLLDADLKGITTPRSVVL
jgi:hypothetical protein